MESALLSLTEALAINAETGAGLVAEDGVEEGQPALAAEIVFP